MEEAVLIGPYVGELFWELFRFYPVVPFRKQQYNNKKGKNVKFIVYTRPDRFDIYGKFADVLIPLELPEKYENCTQDCHGLRQFPTEEYEKLATKFKAKYREKYKILEHIYPKVEKKQFQNKNQIKPKEKRYKYKPRNENFQIVDNQIPQDKPIIIIGPRFRKGLRRNWPNYQRLYELIHNDSKLMRKYNFVICGKRPDCVSDGKNRFYDINDLEYGNNSSLIGVTIALMKNKQTKLVIGSQSAIPNIGMTLGVPILSWGHQKHLHTKTYNIFNTPVDFIEDNNYNTEAKIIYNKLWTTLKKRGLE